MALDPISYNKAQNVQKQLNQAVANGDQLAETQQARVDSKGNPHTTLKERLDNDVSSLSNSLNSVSSDLAQNLKLNFREMLKYPNVFSFPLSLKIYKNSFGTFDVTLDIEGLHPLGKRDGKTYYVSTNGDNGNDGLTPETAFLTLSHAFTMNDVDTIYMVNGEYGRQFCYGQDLPDRHLKIKSLGGKIVLGAFENPSSGEGIPWELHSTGVYKFSRSATVNVYDTKHLNEFGNYTMYTKKTSIADVEAEQGTWYLDTDNMLYVHTLDDRQPESDYDIKVAISGYTIKSTRNKAVYLEGIEFEFGDNSLQIENATWFLAENCKFNYSQSPDGNGLSIRHVDRSITRYCESYENYRDGFNYHAGSWSDRWLNFLEIDNKGYRNGFREGNISNNNGSTSHQNCRGVRINGMYFENKGPNVPDVGSRNYSWNIGVVSYNSRGDEVVPIDFLTENIMWLESCVAYGSNTSLYTQFENAKFYVRNTAWLGKHFVKTPENLIEYAQ